MGREPSWCTGSPEFDPQCHTDRVWWCVLQSQTEEVQAGGSKIQGCPWPQTVSSGSRDIQSVNKQRLNKRECLKFAFTVGGGINIKVSEDCSSEVMRLATFLSTCGMKRMGVISYKYP